jgi:RNA polymerase sigma-70 factor (ECF subfamily)
MVVGLDQAGHRAVARAAQPGVNSPARRRSRQETFASCVNRPQSGRNREAMDDDELIARLAGGDDTALRELFSRHAPWLAARLRVVLPAADVEDVLQETFLAVWRGAGRFQPEGAGGGWLWGIARRQAALWLRRRGQAGSLVDALAQAGRAAADDPAEAALTRADLASAVAALGPPGKPEREVWRLLYVEDRPVAEVAELMGVPAGTVKSRAHRARRLLRAALGGRPAAEGGTQ